MREKREGGEEKREVVEGEAEEIARREWVSVCGGMDGRCWSDSIDGESE